MKISFLVTYYNQKKYVRQSLDSILAIEKPCEWEILIGDDGSTDGTIDVVKEYVQKYPNHISYYVMDREPNRKYEIVRRSSANRLNLIDHMTGDYFCILDGDDWFCDVSFVKEALGIYSKNANCSIVAFGYQKVSDEQGVVSSHCLKKGAINTSEYLRTMYTHAGACVFRSFKDTESYKRVKKIGYYDDNDIVINNFAIGYMYSINKMIYCYRQTENSTYNSMSDLERAVLNSQGYDIDVRYLNDYKDDLQERYSYSLLSIFFMRKSIKEILGKEKCEQYSRSCESIENSFTYKVINYKYIEKKEYASIKLLAVKLFAKNTRMAIGIICKKMKLMIRSVFMR